MEGTQTFFDTDFAEAFARSLPGFDVEAVLASQRKTFEALTRANQLAVEGVQAVARRQAEIARDAIDEASSVLRDIVQPLAPEERIAKNADLMKHGFERCLTDAREINLMLAKATNEAVDVVASRLAETLDEIRDAARKPVEAKKRVAKQLAE